MRSAGLRGWRGTRRPLRVSGLGGLFTLRFLMTEPLAPLSLLMPMFSSAAMRTVVDDRVRLQRMLDFEAALARAEAAVGVIPHEAVEPIVAAAKIERFDLAAIAAAAPAAGNLLTPLLAAFITEVTKENADAAAFVHWGASIQDVIDTAMVLEVRAGLDALIADLDRAVTAYVALAGRYRRTATVARTAMQHELPMPFGLKVAGYAGALGRSRERLKRLRKEALIMQFGGAAGTLAVLGERGFDVYERLAALLDLPLPDAPWHSHRDRLAEVAAALAILAGTCGKIARDVTLLMQTEVAEVLEPAPAAGVSWTTPHKRNPTAAATALACAAMAPQLAATIMNSGVHDYERAAGAWQAEWPTFPALLLAVSGALAAVADLGEKLEVDNERMRVNFDATRGLIMAEAVSVALAGKLGKTIADQVMEEAIQKSVAEKRHLRDILGEDERVTLLMNPGEVARLFEPLSYQGVSQTFIERLVASAQSRVPRR
jgi:3-carboxy-cis,cis-muconate cycloisomerase